MTIIYSNHLDDDCRILATLWNDWSCNVVEILPTTDDYEDIVNGAIAEEEDTLILIGHGTAQGLLHPRFNGEYLIHENNINLIRARRVICMWCYASSFCANNNMSCFASSMFISNVDEAADNYIYDVTQEQINSCNRSFYEQLADIIDNNIPMQDWVMRLGATMDIENPIDTFNRQGLWYQQFMEK